MRRELLSNVGRVGLFLLLALILGCEAERDNPLDPKSPFYKYGGTIIGWVKTRTGEPIYGVKLFAEPDSIMTSTDIDGYYMLQGIVSESTTVISISDEYAQDSALVVVQLGTGREDTANFILNYLPRFTYCKSTSYHPPSNYFLKLEVKVFDGDEPGDLNPDILAWGDCLGDTFILRYDLASGSFGKEIDDKDLPGGSLWGVVGKDIFFTIWDGAGDTVVSEPVQVTRIIENSPVPIYPTSRNDTVVANPEFIWQRSEFPYYFTYKIEISYSESRELVASIENIPSDDTFYHLTSTNLDKAEYLWHLYIVDTFGNSARAGEKLFYVDYEP